METRRHSAIAFFSSIPISLAGGLIGLGGAEFRLPVLAGPLGYSAHQAVPINLAISLVTLLVALVSRATTLSLVPSRLLSCPPCLRSSQGQWSRRFWASPFSVVSPKSGSHA